MTLEALDVDEGNIKDYSGLQAIRESRETLAGQKSIDGTRQMKFKVSEGIHRNLEELLKKFIEIIDDDEAEMPISCKDKLIAPLVSY